MNNVEIKNNKTSKDKAAADSVTISNNIIPGQNNKGAVRVRLFHIDVHSGLKHNSNIIIDVPLGSEERVNLTSPMVGFEVRPLVEGTAYAADDETVVDVFALNDAYEKLCAAVKAVPAIRNDMTLSEADRDKKASAAWAEALRLAS